jgi:hypothetical protein
MRSFLSAVLLMILFAASRLYGQSIYDLVREGTLENLRAACSERGLDAQGTARELKRRLLHYELQQNAVPFSTREESAGEGAVVLNHADFAEYEKNEEGENLLILEGKVELAFAGRSITADSIVVNLDRKLVSGNGNVAFVENEKAYRARSFYYNAEIGEGSFFDASTTLGTLTCRGPLIRVLEQGRKIVAEDVSITSCDLEHPHYRVDAGRLYLYDEERLLIKDASLYYGVDPVIVLPYYYRKLKEPAIKSALYFRQRSGLVSQNTYYPVQNEETSLKLMGDYYERLGFYAGVAYEREPADGFLTDAGGSAAVSNDVYFYDGLTENWSPLGPPTASEYDIDRYVRYRVGLYQTFRFGENVRNDTELNLYWVSDPYYSYDFERRKERFNLLDLIGQAGYDYPRKGDGFTWFLNNRLTHDDLTFSLRNSARFEPQRNTSEDIVSLPDYYQYRLYRVVVPDAALVHRKTILQRSESPVFSDLDYRSSAGYSYAVYYDPEGKPSSEIQNAAARVGLSREYAIIPLVQLTPDLELGAQAQEHTDPSSTQLLDDRQNSLLYSRTRERVTVGSPNLHLELFHDLKYKLYGSEDYYRYGSFRVHDLGIRGYAESGRVTEQFTTSVDLRPVYDWSAERYERFTLDRERFYPFVNTLEFRPSQTISLYDTLVYEIARSEFNLNSFRLKYESNALNLGERPVVVGWELSWRHYFVNPVLDTLRSTFDVSAQVHPYWLLYLSVTSRNDEIWKYFKSGDEKVNPVTDLLKSFNFFNVDDRKESGFKLKGISLGFVHDLHDWVMSFGYTGQRELSYDGSRYVWNNTYSISFGLKALKNLDIRTEFSELRE